MKNLSLIQIMNENFRRRLILRDEIRRYSPSSGLGCSGNRIAYKSPSSTKTLYLLESHINSHDFDFENPNRNRIFHDFEYWYTLFNKNNVLTLAHKELINAISQFPLKNRFIVKHDSRMGISAICEAYITWLQFFRNPSTDASFISSDYSNKNNSKSYFRDFIKLNHKFLGLNRNAVSILTPNMISVMPSSQTNFYITAKQNHLLRGSNPQYILCSNANSFQLFSRNGYEDSLYSICSRLIPNWPHSLVIIESNTDSGLDTYFNQLWHETIWDQNNYEPLEINWHKCQSNSLSLNCSIRNFINNFTQFDIELWNKGLTLEQINWHKNNIQIKNNTALSTAYLINITPFFNSHYASKKNISRCGILRKIRITLLSSVPYSDRNIYFDNNFVSSNNNYFSTSLSSNHIISGKSPPGIKGQSYVAMNSLCPQRVA